MLFLAARFQFSKNQLRWWMGNAVNGACLQIEMPGIWNVARICGVSIFVSQLQCSFLQYL